ncbi:MAG: hypothetical protein Q8K77_02575 [Thermodesulfovibrionales bacterium]|nr:hypothetical protein [Thermodesulfovibrionales bacterium]
MKTASILILLALVIPSTIPHITISDAANNKQSSFFTLDVCSPLSSAATANADMPSLHECMCSLAPLPLISSYTELNPLFNPFITAFQEERPPKV